MPINRYKRRTVDFGRCAGRIAGTLLMAVIAGCGGRAYVYQPLPVAELTARAEMQAEGEVRVSAAVPGAAETEAMFGLPLYEQGIQPVWLKIENGGDTLLRYALVGTDRFYFSPLEVAWKNRGGLSKDGEQALNERFAELAIERYIPAGETRTGFVFTHLRQGAKGVNVDLFGPQQFYYFTFLLRVPGFVPDYANVDFDSIYAAGELRNHDEAGFRAAIAALPCCAADGANGPDGYPLNVILVGKGEDLLYSLLRANWQETAGDDASGGGDSFLFGRRQDGIFLYGSPIDYGFYELRLWLAPMQLEGQLVWMGQLKHVIDHRWVLRRPDPDADNARDFLLQNLWYSQSLMKFGWVAGTEVVPLESLWLSFQPEPYFTDGFRGVYWISGAPVSMLEAQPAGWDVPPPQ